MRALAFEHVSTEILGRNFFCFLEWVDRFSRFFEDTGRDVSGKHFKLPAFVDGKVLQQKHGERIGLFAAGASGTPEAQSHGPLSGCGFLLPFGKDLALEKVEGAGVTEN